MDNQPNWNAIWSRFKNSASQARRLFCSFLRQNRDQQNVFSSFLYFQIPVSFTLTPSAKLKSASCEQTAKLLHCRTASLIHPINVADKRPFWESILNAKELANPRRNAFFQRSEQLMCNERLNLIYKVNIQSTKWIRQNSRSFSFWISGAWNVWILTKLCNGNHFDVQCWEVSPKIEKCSGLNLHAKL